ncbi:flagellar hook-basal body protein [Paenibacillus psychroresistens]|uniref:Flagellar hook-basal body protein n=1 Tax=Paenibacillus psychroresistens TaxID=1778678 RepID=A0A6B8RBE7_9BACL|nr:flagellar hook-basal body protein [Paenibacillus psychroresistens]QGQ93497.1 flagellar hook-basal body protein [Paenibacillus psychroresistens]
MNHSLINSSVTMHAIQQKLDIISNNMANSNTNGYKRKDATFEDILTNIKEQPKGFQKDGRLSPLGFNQGWGAKLSQAQMNLAQGTLAATNISSDLAVEGNALYEVTMNTVDETTGEPVAKTVYTRDGSFNLAVNPQDPANLYLQTKEGNFVNGVNGQPIKFPKDLKMFVDDKGNVTAINPSDSGAIPLQVGQLKLVRVVRPQYLQQIGENLYALPEGLDNANGQILQNVNTGSNLDSPVAIRQGYLEQSNVNLADEMTQLIMVQREYQLTARAVTSSDTMMNLANNLRG